MLMHMDLSAAIIVTAKVHTFVWPSPLKTSVASALALLGPVTGQLKTIVWGPFSFGKDKRLTYSRYILWYI